MSGTGKMKCHATRASVKILKTEEHFTGFDVVDNLLSSIETKKNGIINIFSSEKVEPVEVCTPTNRTSIVNNNPVKKKSQSESSISSPESKPNRSVKRAKKDHDQSESMESVDTVNAQPSLELATPTFNLTYSTPSNRRNSNRKPIFDPIFKLPLQNGWKRELVYRTTGHINCVNRNADVYYYSPKNRKLRSFRDIQEELKLNEGNPFTLENFTFLKQPIGMNDESKELIREANTKVSKESSFARVALRPKKGRIPSQLLNGHKLSDNENKKSSSKVKVSVKNIKRSLKSKSNKDRNNIKTINTSSSTPDEIAGDRQAIKDSMTSNNLLPKSDYVETNTTNNEKCNSEMNSKSMANIQSFSYMTKAMRLVFKYLEIHELLSASRVCNAWNIIAKDRSLWRTVCLKNSMVCNWNKCFDTIDDQGTISLDTKLLLIPTKIEDIDKFWLEFTVALKKAQQLKFLELYRCPTSVVEDTVYSLPQLTSFKATSIKNPNISKEGTNPNKYMTLNLRYLDQMTNLTVIRIKGLSGIKLTNLPSFERLVNLKSLSLTSIKAFPKEICQTLGTLSTSLEYFEIGDCNCLSEDFAGVIKRLKELKSLRFENYYGIFKNFTKKVFSSIRGLDKLNILELINVEFNNDVEDELEKCTNIKGLLIIPVYARHCATTNCHLVDCLKKLKNTITHLVWGLTHELLKATETFITQYKLNQHNIDYYLELSDIRDISNIIPIMRTRKPRQRAREESVTDKAKYKNNVDILSVVSLEKLLEIMMINAKTKVVKTPLAGTTRVYLLEHFNDL